MKKHLLLPLFLIAQYVSHSQTNISWSSPVAVAMGSMYSNVYPRLDLVTGDKPIVIWGKNSPNMLYVSRWTGSAFSSPLTINPGPVSPFVADWAGSELAAKNDTVFITFSAEPVGVNGHVYTVRSTDAGLSFDDTVRVDFLGTDVPRFSSVSIGSGGNPVVNFMRLDGSFGNAEYSVARSMNGGLSYMPDVNASSLVAGNVCDCCPGTVVTSGNKQTILFRNANSNIRTIHAEFSSDGGASYTSNAEIDLTNWIIPACPSSGPSGVIVGDSLIYTWMSKGSGQTRVYIGTVNINDQQIGINKQIFVTSMGNHNFPVIAAKGDTVGVVWEGNVMGAVDVYFSYSTTGAAGIGINVDTITAGMMGDQSRPDIAFNNGKFHVVFSDAMGNDVEYLTGAISSTVGITESKMAGINIISVHQATGQIVMLIESNTDMQAQVEMVNGAGQLCALQELNITAGKHSYYLQGLSSNGMQYVNLITKDSKKHSIKIFVTR